MTTETVPGNDNSSSQLMAIESNSVLEAASPRRSEDVEPLRLVGASDLGDIPEDHWFIIFVLLGEITTMCIPTTRLLRRDRCYTRLHEHNLRSSPRILPIRLIASQVILDCDIDVNPP